MNMVSNTVLRISKETPWLAGAQDGMEHFGSGTVPAIGSGQTRVDWRFGRLRSERDLAIERLKI